MNQTNIKEKRSSDQIKYIFSVIGVIWGTIFGLMFIFITTPLILTEGYWQGILSLPIILLPLIPSINYLRSDNCKKYLKAKNPDYENLSQGKVKEIKCTCNQCGKVWHYLESRKKDLESQKNANAFYACSTCGTPWLYFAANKAGQLRKEIEDLNKCPQCGSNDIKQKEIWYKK